MTTAKNQRRVLQCALLFCLVSGVAHTEQSKNHQVGRRVGC